MNRSREIQRLLQFVPDVKTPFDHQLTAKIISPFCPTGLANGYSLKGLHMNNLTRVGLLVVMGLTIIEAKTECVWATGRVMCQKDQSLVVDSLVELFDADGPQNIHVLDILDKDDKIGFSFVAKEDGLFDVEGCADDFDWFPGFKNLPEIYIRVFHRCNNPNGEYKYIYPTFRVFVPKTYDYHIEHPILLD
uniref:Transthyretin-like family protein n=1 Tax=Steinernema glaseri TaxID=37863 RepID=A0A1I7YDW4_9BILA